MVVVPSLKTEPTTQPVAAAGPVTALLVDRQPLFLDAIATLLAAPPLHAQVTRCVRTDTALELVREQRVDVVLCELNAGPIAASEVVRTLALRQPPIPVILLGDPGDARHLTTALRYPVAGLFTKDEGLDEFLAGVNAVVSGHRAIGAGLMARLLEHVERDSSLEPLAAGRQLSQTEREILAMVGDAASVSTIAATRGISSKTVRNHLAKIYRKLDLHGRTEAVLWAARMGLTTR